MVVQNMVVKPLNKHNYPIKFSKKLFYKFQLFFFVKSFLLQKLINILTRGGKKIKIEKIFINYLYFFKKKNLTVLNSLVSFYNIIELSKPSLELVSKRLGKKLYQIPIPMRPVRQYLRCLRWFKILLIKKKQIKNFVNSLLNEHLNILNDKNKSFLLKKRQQTNLSAVENRMFTHFRWY